MTVDVNVSKYLLADYYWPAFRASIRDGKAKGVMCSCRHQPDILLLPLRAWGFESPLRYQDQKSQKMTPVSKVSCYIIAFNEGNKIRPAIESVIEWADEVNL